MPAPAAPPALSPAAEVVRRSFLDLPARDRAAVLEALAPAAVAPDADPWADVGRDPIPPEVLAELKRDADEVAAGLQPTYMLEEIVASADARFARPLAEQSDRTKTAFAAGRAAAEKAGRPPGEWPGDR